MAIQPAIARQNGRGSSHCNSDFFSSVTKSLLCDLFADTGIRWLQMKHCHCKTCRSPLHADDTRPSRPPIFFLSGTCEGKKQWGRGFEQPVTSELASAQYPCTLAVTERAFACLLHPTWSASLRACERCDLVQCEQQWTGWQPFSGSFRCGSVTCRYLLHASARLKADDELICMMTKAVKELGLEWSPSRSRLDCFYRGAIRLSAQRSSPSTTKCTTSSRNLDACPIRLVSAPLLQPLSLPLTALKRKDTRTWMSPWPQISARQRLSHGRHGATHPSKPCRATSALAGRAYSAAGHAASTLH